MTTSPRAWYRFQNQAADPSVAELAIFDDIGKSWWNDDAVSAKQFMDDLKALPASVNTIVVRVNSLGGDVFDGVAIANALRDQSRSKNRAVDMVVEGIAASAASVVLMAGTSIRVNDNALIMVHNSSAIEWGNKVALRKMADALDKIDGVIVATYQWQSKLSAEELAALMDAETWMNADEAVAKGFATEKVSGLKAAASIDPRAAAQLAIPEQYRARVEALIAKPEPPAPAPVAATTDEIVDVCEAAGCQDLVKTLRGTGATLVQVQARVAEATAAKVAAAAAATAATARAESITALCAKTKQPELAAGYINGAMSIDDVKAHLVIITAKQDRIEIDTNLDPDARSRATTKDVFGVFGKNTKE